MTDASYHLGAKVKHLVQYSGLQVYGKSLQQLTTEADYRTFTIISSFITVALWTNAEKYTTVHIHWRFTVQELEEAKKSQV